MLLLPVAVPAAALLGYLAGYAVASTAALDTPQLHATQLRADQLGHTPAAPTLRPGVTVLSLITEAGEDPPGQPSDLTATLTSLTGTSPNLERPGLRLVPPASAVVSVPDTEIGTHRRLRGIDTSESTHVTR